ncbi:MAG: penicillin-insensitive murein endopeptidase [Myxococcota bacterium]
MVRMLTALAIMAFCGCIMQPLPTDHAISVGTSGRGYLVRGVALGDRGIGYQRVRPGESTRFGTSTLIDAIERAAQSVAEAFPGGRPLLIGDLSSPRGGAHRRHRSHRSGRDADLVFFVRDADGMPAASADWASFDRYGLAVVDGNLLRFDEARNWHLVRTLVLDPNAHVKWIFCSNDVKARLLRYAVRHEPSARAVIRATWILHQPARGDSHADHFHVRVGCAPDERSLGCVEEPPFWPWLSDAASKRSIAAGSRASDRQLVAWLLGEEHVDEVGDVPRGRIDVAPQPTAVAGRDLH